MAVYTKLSSAEIAGFIKQNYQIGELVSFKEIIDGIDNSNFIIETDKGKFILTIFENRINRDELPFFMDLKLHLTKHGINCAKPVENKSGLLLSSIKNKSTSIVSFLNGTTLKPQENGLYSSISTNHCSQIGSVLALMHNAVIDFAGFRKNDLGILGWRKLFDKISDRIENYQNGLKQEVESYINFLEQNWQSHHQSGAIHADLFPDNVFFDESGNLSGVIDFYFAANDLFIYDLAIAINAWCFDGNNKFSEEKYMALLNQYQKNRDINPDEINFLKVALIGASMRFLLTRLNDLFFTPADSLVKIKDPKEYLQKIRFFFDKYENKIVKKY
ncbi:MAG: homoserine kinase [Rickettsiaceae bacterium]|jgi:homoserine kinase type II|nr:homoserine kinase [Rickettsiaceae bacterium]